MPSISLEDRPAQQDATQRNPTPAAAGADRRQVSGLEGALSTIAAVISVAAVSYAVGLLSAPDGSRVNLSVDMLRRGPFDDFLVPGILLLVFVGGASAIASVTVLAVHRFAWQASFVAGTIVMTWVAARLAIMGFGSYMEPLVFAAGATMTVLALNLRRSRLV